MSVAEPTREPLSECGQAALEYARRGWWVFPVHTPVGGKCSCRRPDCSNVGKHPRTQYGLSDATVDPETIYRWWTMWPTANVGISCGPSGLVVIDVDPRHGGDESLRDLVADCGKEITHTLTEATGGGGDHLVFKAPPGTRIGNVSNSEKFTGPLGVGIDVRGEGGYIVAAPSKHESGGMYAWYEGEQEPTEPAPLPDALVKLLDNRATQRSESDRVKVADILGGVPEGRRDWELYRLASNLRRADVPRDWAEKLVLEAADACQPPFPRRDALAKVESAYKRYEPEKGAYLDPDAPAPDVPWQASRINWETFWATDYKTEDWLIEPVIPRSRSVVIYSPAKQGKSLFALDIAARAATGKRLFGQSGEQYTVVYIDLEMTEADVQERLISMGYDASTDFSRFHYYVLPPMRPLDTARGGEELVHVARELSADMVIVDTTSRVLSMPENDADTLRAFYMYTGLGLKNAGISLVRLDHAGKDAERGQRGTSAKNDDVDLVWRLMAGEDGGVTLKATHRRQSWIPEEVALLRHDDPLRHELTARVWEPGSKEMADLLDDLEVPLEWGSHKVRKALADAGHKGARSAVLVDAQRWRRLSHPPGAPKTVPVEDDPWN